MAATRIDQIVSFWVEERDSPLAQRGVGPVYTSLPAGQLRSVWTALSGQVTVALDHSDAPGGSLVYAMFGGGAAALLRRVPAMEPPRTGGSRINTLTHVLLASADVLTPDRAARMRAWPYWFGGGWDGTLRTAAEQVDAANVTRPLATGDLEAGWSAAAAERNQRAALQVPAGAARSLVETVVAGSLRYPDRGLIVQNSPAEPEAAIVTAIDILGPSLRGLPSADWTFSSHEREIGPAGPRFIFVGRQWRRSSHQLEREVVDLVPPALDNYDSVARYLVQIYQTDGPGELAEFLAKQRPPSSAAMVPDWVGRLLPRLRVLVDDDMRVLLQSLTTGTPLDQLPAPAIVAIDAGPWWQALPDKIAALDGPGFRRLLERWQAQPPQARGGTRLDAADLLPPTVTAALAGWAVRAALSAAADAQPQLAGLALDAAVECRTAPVDVIEGLHVWWRDRTPGQDGVEARIRAIVTALDISGFVGATGAGTNGLGATGAGANGVGATGRAAPFDRDRMTAVTSAILTGLPTLAILTTLAEPAGNRDLILFVLTALSNRPTPKQSERARIRDLLARPEVAFFQQSIGLLPQEHRLDPRRGLVRLAFAGDDLARKQLARNIDFWAMNEILDADTLILVQDEAADQNARPTLEVIWRFHSDQIRKKQNFAPLRVRAATDDDRPPPDLTTVPAGPTGPVPAAPASPSSGRAPAAGSARPPARPATGAGKPGRPSAPASGARPRPKPRSGGRAGAAGPRPRPSAKPKGQASRPAHGGGSVLDGLRSLKDMVGRGLRPIFISLIAAMLLFILWHIVPHAR